MKWMILFLLLMATPVQAQMEWNERYDSEYKNDYIAHYAIGAVIGGSVYYFLPDTVNFKPYFDVKFELNKFSKGAIAIGSSMLVKGIMEVFDEGADGRDVLEYGIGAAGSIGVIELFRFTF